MENILNPGTTHPSQATPEQAEQLARKAIGDYLTACKMMGYQPIAIGNYLQDLTAIAGMIMAKAEGSRVAVRRMEAAAQVVNTLMPLTPDGPTQWPAYDDKNPTRFELHQDPDARPDARPATRPVAQPVEPRSLDGAAATKRDLRTLNDMFARVAARKTG